MSRRAIACSATAAIALLSGCATHRPPLVIAAPTPAPVPVQAAALPAGAYPGMVIPARLADGSYPTPNRGLGEDGMVWHLRAALNVAALACRGAQGDMIVAGYNAMLGREKAPLAAAQAHYAAAFRDAGASAYDDSMTRLYNFFSQSQVRTGFCAAAAQVLGESVAVAPADLPAFARTALPELERPFTDFYRAYDAWRDGARAPIPQAVIAVASTPVLANPPSRVSAPVPVAAPAAAPAPLRAAAPIVPKLQIDPSVFAN
ncbi:hypothetical protein [Sphingomonas sp. CROZ-RG-20F-R02-07]|uniref:hypothetical protein n=1 Tax=Sphingomonas sp. CROZ-RG-20F-R02-07 TaxID=2914832 RepID=UPI001F580FFF|nr:hypothetical protein [Sphingomonas sp. CROZ-RG-20F-R02-07]